jgi:hypothetical protein
MPALRSLVSSLAWVCLVAGACEKESTLVVPEDVSTDAGETESESATVVLRYRRGARTLRQSATLETRTNGTGQVLTAKIDFSANLTLTEQGSKLRVVWALDDVGEVAASGAPAEGGVAPAREFLLQVARGAYLTDLMGRTDAAVSQALVENRVMQDKIEEIAREVQRQTAAGESPTVPAGADVLPYLQPVVQLPTLPEHALEIGKATTITKDESRELGSVGVSLPLTIRTTYTLLRVDASGTARVAEVKLSGSAGGRTQGPHDVGAITIQSDYDGTLRFDLERGDPVSYEVTRAERWTMGPIDGDTTTTIRARWERRS